MEIKTIELLNALEKINALQADKNNPRSKLVNLNKKDDKLFLSRLTWDETLKISIQSETAKTCDWKATFDAKALLRIIKKLKSKKQIQITSGQNKQLTIDCLTLYPDVELDEHNIEELNRPFFVTHWSKEDLQKAIAVCEHAVGNCEARRNLIGLNYRNRDESQQWTSADGFRIARYKIESANQNEADCILNPLFVKTWKKIVKFIDCDSLTFSISEDKERFSISAPGFLYKSKLIEAEFPNLDRLQEAGDLKITMPTKKALDRLDILKSALPSLSDKTVVKISNEEGKLFFQSQLIDDKLGAKVEIDGEVWKSMKIGLNLHFFEDALKVCNTQKLKKISLRNNNAETPLNIEFENTTLTLLPVKIRW